MTTKPLCAICQRPVPLAIGGKRRGIPRLTCSLGCRKEYSKRGLERFMKRCAGTYIPKR